MKILHWLGMVSFVLTITGEWTFAGERPTQIVGRGASNTVPDTQVVEAKGIGKDEAEARKQAYRDAVQQVVGALVVSDVRIDNGKLIQENIISNSDGYIKAVEKISLIPTGDGNVEITIRATVEKGKLTRFLADKNIKVKVDGQSLGAEATTKLDAALSAQEMLIKFLTDSNFPASLYGAKKTANPSYSVEKRRAIIDFEVFVDKAKYKQFADLMQEKMRIAGVNRRQQKLEYTWKNNYNGSMYLDPRESDGKKRFNILPAGKTGILIASNVNKQCTIFTWDAYVLSDELFSDVQALIMRMPGGTYKDGIWKKWYVRVECQSLLGDILYSVDLEVPRISVNFDKEKDGAWSARDTAPKEAIFIFPVFLHGNEHLGSMYTPLERRWYNDATMAVHGDGHSIKMSAEIDLSPDKLHDVADVVFTFYGK